MRPIVARPNVRPPPQAARRSTGHGRVCGTQAECCWPAKVCQARVSGTVCGGRDIARRCPRPRNSGRNECRVVFVLEQFNAPLLRGARTAQARRPYHFWQIVTTTCFPAEHTQGQKEKGWAMKTLPPSPGGVVVATKPKPYREAASFVAHRCLRRLTTN